MSSKLFIFVVLTLFFDSEACNSRRRRKRRREDDSGGGSPCKEPCVVSDVTDWSQCSSPCGTSGIQHRKRTIVHRLGCTNFPCPSELYETQKCNRESWRCNGHGTQYSGGCRCFRGYTGTCCGRDINECSTQRPCQHSCRNTMGSYTCSCYSCYTKYGSRCYLEKCKIDGECYRYGQNNPSNPCQHCQRSQRHYWTNKNRVSCNDGKACTRYDRCRSGTCAGTPFTCLPCEECYNDYCRIKPGYCIIRVWWSRRCFRDGEIRSGYPCQECDSNRNSRWTNNNNLKCSDGNLKTRDDRCLEGTCVGTPYSCLTCERHNGIGCVPKRGYCAIQHSNQRTCFSSGQVKPGNPCQICNPNRPNAWTNRNAVSCNDNNPCTANDKCISGQCVGTPIVCKKCQYCNGTSCSLKTGFGYVNGECTCKIEDQDYWHQSLNPVNQCQWCDLHDAAARASGTWSDRPSVPCNDNNNCTKHDICSSGQCTGQDYSCNFSYSFSSCIETSLCAGDGTCIDSMKPAGTVCRPAMDSCDQPERCDGALGSCPLKQIDSINVSVGTVQFRDERFSKNIRFQFHKNKLNIETSGFDSNCGKLSTRWFLLKGDAACKPSSNINGTLASTNRLHTMDSVTLKNNKTYRIAVEIKDSRERLYAAVCTPALTIDTTPPKNGWIRDGPGTDLSYQSTKLVQANWGGVQARHGVGMYEWKVLYRSLHGNGTKELSNFIKVNLSTRASKMFDNIKDGSKVKSIVRVYTKAGLYADLFSDGVTVDTSPPRASLVLDGEKADLKYVTWQRRFKANWEPFVDPHSSISHYKVAVKRVGAGLVSTFRNVALRTAVTIGGVNLISGERYCAFVKGYNLAGLSTEATSNCVLIDHDAPRPGKIFDGVKHEINYQSQRNRLSAHWKGFHDGVAGSGIVEYRYKIKDSTGKVIVNWTSVENKTSFTIDRISLVDKEKYFVTVEARDAAGLTTSVTSDGVKIDLTRPVFNGNVTVKGESGYVNGSACIYVPSTSELMVQWPEFSDSQSGLKHYEWAIIPAAGRVSEADFKKVPGNNLQTSSTFSGLNLDEGKLYLVIIRAINRAGLHKDAHSIPIIPDATPPSPGQVFDGSKQNTDLEYSTDLESVFATWTEFKEPNSGIKQYYYAVGSCQPGNYHITGNTFVEIDLPVSLKLALFNVSLQNGQRYCIKIKAKNLAGLYSDEVSSNGFLVDSSPPDILKSRVYDGLDKPDKDYQSSTTTMSAHWEGFVDQESGIKYYKYAISQSNCKDLDETFFTNIGLNTSIDVTGLQLQEEVYYIVVCAVNFASLHKCKCSDGVLIDATPPSKGIVNDGMIEPDIKYQTSLTVIRANWEGVWSLKSKIDKFEWAFGTSKEQKTSIQNYTDVGLSTHVKSSEPLKLVNGQTYYVYLRATNKAGSVTEMSSDGVTIDSTPPHTVKMFTGFPSNNSQWSYDLEDKSFYSSSRSVLAVYWNQAQETESELWYYKWAIGTSRCGTQVQPFINIGRAVSVNTTNLDLQLVAGIEYYVTVIARNRAGLQSQSCSDPFILDDTPPSMGKVTVGLKKMKHRRFLTRKEQIIQWDGFFDFESTIKKFEIQILDKKERLFWKTTSKSSLNYDFTDKELTPGKVFYAAVTCFNKAGLYTFAMSSPFVIDTSPPIYNGSIIAGVARDSSLQYQPFTNSMTATWTSFTDPESPIEKYEFAVGTSPEKDDIVEFEDVRLSKTFTKELIELSHSSIYYVSVRATNAAGLSSTKTSIGVLIDTSPPLVNRASVFDGQGGEDIGFFNSSVIGAHWEGFHDPESGILRYEYCLGTSPSACQILTFVDVGHNTSFECYDCDIHPAEIVFVTVRVTNKAGLTTAKTSDGMLFDSTPPVMEPIVDVKNDHLPTDTNTVLIDWNISMAWSGARDRQSGISKCTWTVESSTGEIFNSVLITNVTGGKYVSYITSKKYREISQNANDTFFNVVRCLNRAGVQGTRKSNGFKIKRQWPLQGEVRDGLEHGIDRNFLTSTKTLNANWDIFMADDFDPVTKYAWAVGTTAGKDDILQWTGIGLATSAFQDLAPDHIHLDILTPGKKYYVTVEATSASGLSTRRSSNGFIVDPTPPELKQVRVYHSVTDQESKTVAVTVEWRELKDEESGIQDVTYYIEPIPQTWTFQKKASGKTRFGKISGLKPLEGVSYFVTVIANNGAGLNTVMTSREFQFDPSPPSRGYVLDGYGNDIDFTNNSETMQIEWGGFEDRDSGVKKCTWILIQQQMFKKNVLNSTKETQIFRQTVPVSGRAIRGGLSLIPQYHYFNRIACENRDGFVTVADADGLRIDITPPVPGTVYDGSSLAVDVDYLSPNSSIQAVWTAFKDIESGIVQYRWGLGTGIGTNDVMVLSSVGRNTFGAKNDVTLVPGLRYYITVEATNGASLKTQSWSDGFLVDDTAPELTITSKNNNSWIGLLDKPSATWEASDSESGIHSIDYCVGTTPQGCQVKRMTSISSNSTYVTCHDCETKHRVTYFVTVRVNNGAKLFTLATSRGVKVDLSPPYTGKITLIYGQYTACTTNCTLTSLITGFEDMESGIKSCRFAVRNESVFTTGFESVKQNYKARVDGMRLVHGQQYYMVATCTNNVGLESNVTASSKITVDSTSPQKGSVIVSVDKTHDILGVHSSCHPLNRTLRAHWFNFSDDESGISTFRVALGERPYGADFISFVEVGITTNVTLPITGLPGLYPGCIVYVTVEAENGAGLVTRSTSPPTRLVSLQNEELLREGDFRCLGI